ncbi:Serine/threonine-protein kinase Nek8 [Chionoecetes opilio]|uniref:Serine/threonine-protein kinase Nek8 n=1 Tax=Chionoecetes opilio TaxID=41210 RepID=A0A8J4XSX2_CHIOP|nr:Serine/threonine-protein kinase Nek8 [Chionoecetes opilio]
MDSQDKMDDYKLVQSIGRGAYGYVYLYRRLSDGRLVVIKQLPMESISPEECEVTKNEVRVLSMLQHPNIIEYYDNYLDVNTMMIMMEYAPGGNLYDYLRSRGEGNLLQEEDVLHLFSQLVLGMQHIHESNILHRDIKSNNILLDKSHRIVKIGDFGISKILSSKSKAHTVVGTPCYLSPELCQEKPYNQKSDVWALGCVLYEMLTLRRAFEAETLPALIMKIMRGIISPIHAHYTQEMRGFLQLLLHMDPAQRPTIAQVLAQPLVFPSLLRLHADLGMIHCVSRPLRLSSVTPDRLRTPRGSVDGRVEDGSGGK